MRYTGLLDMIDGGGAGQSGDTFKGGGLLSALLNSLGVKPRGFNDRPEPQGAPMVPMTAMRQQPMPQPPQAAPQGLASSVRPQMRPPQRQPSGALTEPYMTFAPQFQQMQGAPAMPGEVQAPSFGALEQPDTRTFERFVADLGAVGQGFDRETLWQAYLLSRERDF